MAEKDNIYGGLGNLLPKFLDSPFYGYLEQLPKYPATLGARGLGLFQDALGVLGENLNAPDFAKDQRSKAQDMNNLAQYILESTRKGGSIYEVLEGLDKKGGLEFLRSDAVPTNFSLNDDIQKKLNQLTDPRLEIPVKPLGKELSTTEKENIEYEQYKKELENASTNIKQKEESVADLKKEVEDSGEIQEDFREEEEKKLQGTVPTPENVQKSLDTGFIDAVKEYLNASGKKPKSSGVTGGARDLDFYKKEFAKATGVNITGKPDKSNFLMALGLGLMQNRAGKGFNVGKILSAVGEATEKAMPELKEAQKQAKAELAAAGKYALQTLKSKQASAASAASALAKEERAFARTLFLKQMERETELLKARAKGIELKDSYFSEPVRGLKIRYANTATSSGVFANPREAVNNISSALSNTDKAINTLDQLDVQLRQIGQADSPAIKIIGDRVLTALSGLGIVDPIKTFGKEGMSPEDLATALRESVIQEFKRFLTQETGNGISNIDVQNIQALLGVPGLMKNPQEYLKRIELVKSIFIGKRKKLRTLTDDLMDINNFRNETDFNVAQDGLKDIFKDFTDFKLIPTTGNTPLVDLT